MSFFVCLTEYIVCFVEQKQGRVYSWWRFLGLQSGLESVCRFLINGAGTQRALVQHFSVSGGSVCPTARHWGPVAPVGMQLTLIFVIDWGMDLANVIVSLFLSKKKLLLD